MAEAARAEPTVTPAGGQVLPSWARPRLMEVAAVWQMLGERRREPDRAGARREVVDGLVAALHWALEQKVLPAPVTGRPEAPDALVVRAELLASLERSGQQVPQRAYQTLGVDRWPARAVPTVFAQGVCYMLGWLVGIYDQPPVARAAPQSADRQQHR